MFTRSKNRGGGGIRQFTIHIVYNGAKYYGEVQELDCHDMPET